MKAGKKIAAMRVYNHNRKLIIWKQRWSVFFLSLFVLALFGFVSCDEHEAVDLNIHVGHILCADGKVLSESEFFEQDATTAVGVIFSERLSDNRYLAVLLEEVKMEIFCDSVDYKQNTSCALDKYDGYSNTVNLQNSFDKKTGHGSPLADYAFCSHKYGQSDFIPSVAEMRLLFSSRDKVNAVMQHLNNSGRAFADLLTTVDDETGSCWLWTSTEVECNPSYQAWLFSMSSGSYQETPKVESHNSRLIVSYYPIDSTN